MLKLQTRINEAEIVHSGPELVLVHAQLRVDCERIGHALSQRDHDADRWVAATALRLGIPLVSNNGIFNKVPGLALESVPYDCCCQPTQSIRMRDATSLVTEDRLACGSAVGTFALGGRVHPCGDAIQREALSLSSPRNECCERKVFHAGKK